MSTKVKEKTSNAIVRDCLLRNIQEFNNDGEEGIFTTPDYANQMKIIIALHGIGEVDSARQACINMYASMLELQPNYINWFVECVKSFKFQPVSRVELGYESDEFNRLLFNIQRVQSSVHVQETRVRYDDENEVSVMDIHYCADEFRKLSNPFMFDATANYTDMLEFVAELQNEDINNYMEEGQHREKTIKFRYNVEDLSDRELSEIYLNNGGRTIIKELE